MAEAERAAEQRKIEEDKIKFAEEKQRKIDGIVADRFENVQLNKIRQLKIVLQHERLMYQHQQHETAEEQNLFQGNRENLHHTEDLHRIIEKSNQQKFIDEQHRLQQNKFLDDNCLRSQQNKSVTSDRILQTPMEHRGALEVNHNLNYNNQGCVSTLTRPRNFSTISTSIEIVNQGPPVMAGPSSIQARDSDHISAEKLTLESRLSSIDSSHLYNAWISHPNNISNHDDERKKLWIESQMQLQESRLLHGKGESPGLPRGTNSIGTTLDNQNFIPSETTLINYNDNQIFKQYLRHSSEILSSTANQNNFGQITHNSFIPQSKMSDHFVHINTDSEHNVLKTVPNLNFTSSKSKHQPSVLNHIPKFSHEQSSVSEERRGIYNPHLESGTPELLMRQTYRAATMGPPQNINRMIRPYDSDRCRMPNLTNVYQGHLAKNDFRSQPSPKIYMPAANSRSPSVNAMIPSVNAMIPSVNAMIPSVNAMIPSVNAMIPSVNAMNSNNCHHIHRLLKNESVGATLKNNSPPIITSAAITLSPVTIASVISAPSKNTIFPDPPQSWKDSSHYKKNLITARHEESCGHEAQSSDIDKLADLVPNKFMNHLISNQLHSNNQKLKSIHSTNSNSVISLKAGSPECHTQTSPLSLVMNKQFVSGPETSHGMLNVPLLNNSRAIAQSLLPMPVEEITLSSKKSRSTIITDSKQSNSNIPKQSEITSVSTSNSNSQISSTVSWKSGSVTSVRRQSANDAYLIMDDIGLEISPSAVTTPVTNVHIGSNTKYTGSSISYASSSTTTLNKKNIKSISPDDSPINVVDDTSDSCYLNPDSNISQLDSNVPQFNDVNAKIPKPPLEGLGITVANKLAHAKIDSSEKCTQPIQNVASVSELEENSNDLNSDSHPEESSKLGKFLKRYQRDSSDQVRLESHSSFYSDTNLMEQIKTLDEFNVRSTNLDGLARLDDLSNKASMSEAKSMSIIGQRCSDKHHIEPQPTLESDTLSKYIDTNDRIEIVPNTTTLLNLENQEVTSETNPAEVCSANTIPLSDPIASKPSIGKDYFEPLASILRNDIMTRGNSDMEPVIIDDDDSASSLKESRIFRRLSSSSHNSDSTDCASPAMSLSHVDSTCDSQTDAMDQIPSDHESFTSNLNLNKTNISPRFLDQNMQKSTVNLQNISRPDDSITDESYRSSIIQSNTELTNTSDPNVDDNVTSDILKEKTTSIAIPIETENRSSTYGNLKPLLEVVAKIQQHASIIPANEAHPKCTNIKLIVASHCGKVVEPARLDSNCELNALESFKAVEPSVPEKNIYSIETNCKHVNAKDSENNQMEEHDDTHNNASNYLGSEINSNDCENRCNNQITVHDSTLSTIHQANICVSPSEIKNTIKLTLKTPTKASIKDYPADFPYNSKNPPKVIPLETAFNVDMPPSKGKQLATAVVFRKPSIAISCSEPARKHKECDARVSRPRRTVAKSYAKFFDTDLTSAAVAPPLVVTTTDPHQQPFVNIKKRGRPRKIMQNSNKVQPRDSSGSAILSNFQPTSLVTAVPTTSPISAYSLSLLADTISKVSSIDYKLQQNVSKESGTNHETAAEKQNTFKIPLKLTFKRSSLQSGEYCCSSDLTSPFKKRKVSSHGIKESCNNTSEDPVMVPIDPQDPLGINAADDGEPAFSMRYVKSYDTEIEDIPVVQRMAKYRDRALCRKISQKLVKRSIRTPVHDVNYSYLSTPSSTPLHASASANYYHTNPVYTPLHRISYDGPGTTPQRTPSGNLKIHLINKNKRSLSPEKKSNQKSKMSKLQMKIPKAADHDSNVPTIVQPRPLNIVPSLGELHQSQSTNNIKSPTNLSLISMTGHDQVQYNAPTLQKEKIILKIKLPPKETESLLKTVGKRREVSNTQNKSKIDAASVPNLPTLPAKKLPPLIIMKSSDGSLSSKTEGKKLMAPNVDDDCTASTLSVRSEADTSPSNTVIQTMPFVVHEKAHAEPTAELPQKQLPPRKRKIPQVVSLRNDCDVPVASTLVNDAVLKSNQSNENDSNQVISEVSLVDVNNRTTKEDTVINITTNSSNLGLSSTPSHKMEIIERQLAAIVGAPFSPIREVQPATQFECRQILRSTDVEKDNPSDSVDTNIQMDIIEMNLASIVGSPSPPISASEPPKNDIPVSDSVSTEALIYKEKQSSDAKNIHCGYVFVPDIKLRTAPQVRVRKITNTQINSLQSQAFITPETTREKLPQSPPKLRNKRKTCSIPGVSTIDVAKSSAVKQILVSDKFSKMRSSYPGKIRRIIAEREKQKMLIEELGDSQEGDSQEGDSQEGDSQEGDSQEGDSQEGDSQEGGPQEGDSQEAPLPIIYKGIGLCQTDLSTKKISRKKKLKDKTESVGDLSVSSDSSTVGETTRVTTDINSSSMIDSNTIVAIKDKTDNNAERRTSSRIAKRKKKCREKKSAHAKNIVEKLSKENELTMTSSSSSEQSILPNSSTDIPSDTSISPILNNNITSLPNISNTVNSRTDRSLNFDLHFRDGFCLSNPNLDIIDQITDSPIKKSSQSNDNSKNYSSYIVKQVTTTSNDHFNTNIVTESCKPSTSSSSEVSSKPLWMTSTNVQYGDLVDDVESLYTDSLFTMGYMSPNNRDADEVSPPAPTSPGNYFYPCYVYFPLFKYIYIYYYYYSYKF